MLSRACPFVFDLPPTEGWTHHAAVKPLLNQGAQCRLFFAARRFKSQRADFYDYLADLIAATGGAKTLQQIFQDDAHRYAVGSVRGVLSTHWAAKFPQTGGDLFATWFGTLPTEDLVAVQAAQYAGAGALVQTLRQLASVVRVTDSARRAFMQTVLTGLLSLFVAAGSVLLIPFFTADQLARAFSSLPAEYYGPLAQSLFKTAQFLRSTWWLFLLFIGGAGWACFWSLPHFVGPLRTRLDQWALWRLYRIVQSVRFLSLLAILLRPRGNVGARLREALLVLQVGSATWLGRHIDQMLRRIDAGFSVTESLDTGLVEEQLWWYFTDMVATLGLDVGLQRTALRVSQHTVKKLASQALMLRWCLLFFSIAIVLGIAFWHFRVFEELRQGLSLYYAG